MTTGGEFDSPYPFLVKNVEQLHSQQITFAQFLANLDFNDVYLRHWALALQNLQLPARLPSAPHLLEGIRQAVEMIWQCCGELRDPDTHDDEARLEAALELAREGHEVIREVLRVAEDTLDELD
jgi:hypothetical protein